MRVRCVYLDVQIRTFRCGTRLRRLLIRERGNWRWITLSSRRISFRGRIGHWSWTGVSSGCVIVILAATWPNRQLPRGGVRCARNRAVSQRARRRICAEFAQSRTACARRSGRGGPAFSPVNPRLRALIALNSRMTTPARARVCVRGARNDTPPRRIPIEACEALHGWPFPHPKVGGDYVLISGFPGVQRLRLAPDVIEFGAFSTLVQVTVAHKRYLVCQFERRFGYPIREECQLMTPT